MSETNAPAAPTRTLACSQCATPVPLAQGEVSARCPACGALVKTGEGTYFGLGWRFAIAGNVLFLVAAGFAILVAVNYLANKYFIRRDATFARAYTLSETTKLLLQKISNDKVKVEVYFLTGRSDGRTMEVVKHTLQLLEEYQQLSGDMVKFEERPLFANPKAILEVCDKTNIRVEDIEENEVIFYCDSTKKNKSVKFYELYESDSMGPMGGDADAKYKFKGEAVLTAGIQEVTEAKKTLLYFVTGHGEYQLTDFNQFGLSDLDRQLKSKENYETKELNLAQGKVPEDASAVVLVRPKTKFAPTEMDALRNYLDQGGRLLVLLNSNRDQAEKDPQEIDDLLTMLSNWGIEVGRDFVYEGDPMRTSFGFATTDMGQELAQSTGPMIFNVVEYGYHEVTRKLEGTGTWFMVARSVKKAAQVPEGITVVEIAKTSRDSASIHESVRKGQPPPGMLTHGPISVAVAAEKSTPGGGENAPKTRIVVLGDADGVTNAVNQQFGRNQLVTNALRWLTGREHLISGIEPIETSDPKLNLSKADKDRIGAITMIAMPGTFILLAVATWFLRRK